MSSPTPLYLLAIVRTNRELPHDRRRIPRRRRFARVAAAVPVAAALAVYLAGRSS